jgi:hypothetical protein
MKSTRSTPVAKPDIPPPSHDEIVARAHRLWLEAGRPEGRDREHWAEAERQLRGHKATTVPPPEAL